MQKKGRPSLHKRLPDARNRRQVVSGDVMKSAERTAFVARFIVLREGRRSRAHRQIEQLCWEIETTAEDLYNPVSLGGGTSGNNDLLKKVAVNAAQGLLSQPKGASTAGRISAMGGGGGGQRAPYNPMLPPPAPSLPSYFDFGYNPFGGYA